MLRILRAIGTGARVTTWFVIALTGVPVLIALGLWLLGFSLDWSSWKTYTGIITLAVAMVLASN